MMTPEELAETKKLIYGFTGDCPGLMGQASLKLINEIERLQILFAYTEGDLPGRVAAKALGADGFEMTLLIEAAVKAGEELVKNGYPLKNDSLPTP